MKTVKQLFLAEAKKAFPERRPIDVWNEFKQNYHDEQKEFIPYKKRVKILREIAKSKSSEVWWNFWQSDSTSFSFRKKYIGGNDYNTEWAKMAKLCQRIENGLNEK